MSHHDESHAEDDLFLEELRGLAAEGDPVPERVLAAARGSFTWRTIDTELAELAYDSALDAERAFAVRSEDTVRLLTFETSELTIELEVTAEGDRRRILGQIAPAAVGTIELRHAGGALELRTDELFGFQVPLTVLPRVSGVVLPGAGCTLTV